MTRREGRLIAFLGAKIRLDVTKTYHAVPRLVEELQLYHDEVKAKLTVKDWALIHEATRAATNVASDRTVAWQNARAKKLRVIRAQLKHMGEFMSRTPTHDPLWWCGKMPAYPNEYVPEEWQARNRAVFLIWLDYLVELEHQHLTIHRALANNLPVADLLAASKEESEK